MEGGFSIAKGRLSARRKGAGEGFYLARSPNSPNTPSVALAWDMMERRKIGGALSMCVDRFVGCERLLSQCYRGVGMVTSECNVLNFVHCRGLPGTAYVHLLVYLVDTHACVHTDYLRRNTNGVIHPEGSARTRQLEDAATAGGLTAGVGYTWSFGAS